MLMHEKTCVIPIFIVPFFIGEQNCMGEQSVLCLCVFYTALMFFFPQTNLHVFLFRNGVVQTV